MSEESKRTEYVVFHTKTEEVLMGHSPIYDKESGVFLLRDVLLLRESYIPVSLIPIVTFSKYVTYAKNWAFQFRTDNLVMLLTTDEIQESFILFYEWCRDSLKESQDESLNDILLGHMISKGVDLSKLIQDPADEYLYKKFENHKFGNSEEEKNQKNPPVTVEEKNKIIDMFTKKVITDPDETLH